MDLLDKVRSVMDDQDNWSSLALKVGLTPGTLQNRVKSLLNKEELDKLKSNRSKGKDWKPIVQNMLELLREGVSLSKACSEVGLSRAELSRQVKNLTKEELKLIEDSKSNTRSTSMKKVWDRDYNEKIKSQEEGCLRKYGVSRALQSKEIRDKARANSDGLSYYRMQEAVERKYGVSNAANIPGMQEKKKEKLLEKYGVESLWDIPGYREKLKQTLKNNYGVEHNSQSPEVREKCKNTCIERYGKPHYLMTEEGQEKSRYTLYKNLSELNPNYMLIASKEAMVEYLNLHEKMSVLEFCKKTGMEHTVVYSRRNKWDLRDMFIDDVVSKTSSQERELRAWVESLGIPTNKIEANASKRLMELDIVIPSKSLAIEYNGLYYHSTLKHEDVNYHLKKKEYAESLGYDLIHVWDDEWKLKPDIVKSQIKVRLGLSERIYARKTTLVEVGEFEAHNFYNKTHYQGYIPGVHLALIFNDDIVGMMTFGRARFGASEEFELLRESYKLDTVVVGGSEKLFKGFKQLLNFKSVYTFVDRCKFTGKHLLNLGFRLVNTSKPSYWWYDSSANLRIPRSPSKHEELKCLPKIYNCGQMRFVYDRES